MPSTPVPHPTLSEDRLREQVQQNIDALRRQTGIMQSALDALAAGTYTDEQVRDVIGAALVATPTVDFSVDDGLNTISAEVPLGSIGTGHLAFDPATQTELDTAAADKVSKSSTSAQTLAGQIQFITGSNTAPGLAFSGDSNTGFYSSAADTIDAATGGTRRLTISSAGLTVQSGVVLAPNGSGTTTVYRMGAATCGLFGSSSANRIGLKAGNFVGLDIDFNNGYIKTQNLPLKTEAGFAAGAYDTAIDDFIYLANGSLVRADSSGGPLALQMADDVTDPIVVDGFDGGEVTIKDSTGSAAGNPITITDVSASPVDGGTTVTIDTDWGWVELSIADGMWLITGGDGYTVS